MTNLLTWQDRIRRELRKQWWQTVTAILALGLGAGLWLAFTGGDDSAGASAGCATSGAVADAADNPGLVADCETLLALRDTLAGGATLNWSASLPIQRWTGVFRVSGRVAYVLLESKQLRGTLPATLGDIEGLRYLDLRGNFLTGSIPAELGGLPRLVGLRLANNRLTGSIPAELGNLQKLSIVQLSGNGLTGCVPAALRKVYQNDLAKLSLATCGAPKVTPTPTATTVATTTPTATATTEAEETYTLTLTQAANGRLVAVPAGPYTSSVHTAVTVTATPDHGYELTAWGGDCASTAATSATCVVDMNADRSVTATFGRAKPPATSGPLWLIVISKGDADALTLEWTGGPTNATRWQYRTRTWANHTAQAWGSWANVPNSTGTTRSYRLTGLRADVAYDAQVRPVVSGTPGTASNVGEGHTYRKGSIPYIDPGQFVEGDGTTKWRLHRLGFTFVIPDGMLLKGDSAGIADNGAPVSGVKDVTTGSWLWLSNLDGTEWSRKIVTPVQGEGRQVPIDPNRDVGRLFDQIVASVRDDR